MCGGMSLSLEPGDFFEGLKSRKTTNGKQFRRKSQIVETFPDQLTVTVRVNTGPCIGPADPRQRSANLERYDAEFIKSFQFEGVWKSGLLSERQMSGCSVKENGVDRIISGRTQFCGGMSLELTRREFR